MFPQDDNLQTVLQTIQHTIFVSWEYNYSKNGLEWTGLEWTFGPKPPQRLRVDFSKKWKFYKLLYAFNQN